MAKQKCNHDTHHVDAEEGIVYGRGPGGYFNICEDSGMVNATWRREFLQHLQGKDHPNGWAAAQKEAK